MSAIRLAIVGCGGMGTRHLTALAELQRAGLSPFELVAACDPVAENAAALADAAEEQLGRRPTTYASLEQIGADELDAIDIPASPKVHHTLAVSAMQRGWHVMVEKPMGLTVRSSRLIADAAADTGKVLSVAENYRRDPINRLGKALLEQGLIGAPRFALHNSVGGGNRMLISVWRHLKEQSGVLIDVGVHFFDILEYYLGEIDMVYAQTRLHEPIRHNPARDESGRPNDPAGVYARWQQEMPADFEATAEDAAYATLTFKSGAVGQYIEDHAGRGEGIWNRQIQGSAGSLNLPNDRTGRPITLTLADGNRISGPDLLPLVPDFHLDPATATLFGSERLAGYEMPFEITDRKLIAVEYADFADAINNGNGPEVGAREGLRAVAGAYATLESNLAGRAVSMDDVLNSQFSAYQDEIDQYLGIL